VRLIYQIACKHCGIPILLRGAMLQRQFQDQDDLSKGYYPTVVGCPQCRRASIYTQFLQLGMERTPYSTPPVQTTELWCGIASCGLSVRAIVPSGEDGYEEVMRGWIYLSDVKCESGHVFDPQCRCEECLAPPCAVE
jgi:hypothetical protein